MPLRRKTLKVAKENDSRIGSILSRKSGQAYVKPSCSQSQVDLRPLPALRPSSPLFNSPTHSSIFTPLTDTPSPRVRKQHRRSRSFSALSPSKILASGSHHSPSLRVSNAAVYDPFANLDGARDPSSQTGAQPWRSQETWQALHSPTLKPTVIKERPYGEAGWRGNGTFFAGSQTSLATVKTIHRTHPKEGSIKSSRTSKINPNDAPSSPSVPQRQSSLRISRRSAVQMLDWSSPFRRPSLNLVSRGSPSLISPSPRTSQHTITSSEETNHSHVCTPISEMSTSEDRIPASVEAPSTPQRSNTVSSRAESDDDDDTLLPPLTPKSILKSPSRTNSFATLPPAATPIPWGRRGSSPYTSAPASRSITPAPPTPHTPLPRSRSGSVSRRSAAPSRALPRPPPDVPNSPEIDFSTIKPVFPSGQSSQKLQAAIEASRAIPRSISQGSLTRGGRERSGSVLTHESSESNGSNASVRVMTPRTELAPLLPVSYDMVEDDSRSTPSPNKRAGMMFVRTPSPRKGSAGGRGLSSAGSSMSLASVKSVERGGWL